MSLSNRIIQNEITSKDNPKIKFLKQLRQKKYRDESGKFLVENAVIIHDAAKAGVIPEMMFVTEVFLEKNRELYDFIVAKCGVNECYMIDEKINRSFSSMDTAPGIAAIYSKPRNKMDLTKPVIYLNAINDPGNLGTILRSALAFGLKNIVIDEHCADVYNPKTVSAAKDAIFKLNIEPDEDLWQLHEIKKIMPVISTRLEKSDGLELLKKQKLFCIVLGSESHGVDEAIQKVSDDFVRIPMSGEIESLNVAAGAAIIFYEIYNNNRANSEIKL